MSGCTAADVLLASGIDSARVRAVLPRVDPALIPLRVAPAWLRRIWGRGIVAFTAPWAIYVHPATLAIGDERLGGLIAHELVHTEQWRRFGWLRQAVTYVVSYLRLRIAGHGHTRAYHGIPQEIEARRVAAGLVGQSPL